MSSKPEVSIPAEDAPTTLVIEDLVVGTGDEAKAGRNVDVHYVGVAWSTGKQFDASWDRNETFEFRLGAGQVIQGWDQVFQQIKVGEKRLVIIPPELAYGTRGQPPKIPRNATLVFEVELLEIIPD